MSHEATEALVREEAERVDRLELTLRRIMGTECESFTSGIGSCYPERSDLARYGAERACNACQAWAALYPEEAAERKQGIRR